MQFRSQFALLSRFFAQRRLILLPEAFSGPSGSRLGRFRAIKSFAKLLSGGAQFDTRAAISRLTELVANSKSSRTPASTRTTPRIHTSEHFLNAPRDSKGLTSDECP